MTQFHGIITPHTLSILPHPSNKDIIPKYEDLINNYLELAQKIAKFKPDTIIIISPRGTCFLEALTLNTPKDNEYKALLSEIDKPDQNYQYDKANAHSILKQCQEQLLPIKEVENNILDYGAITPLIYLLSKLENQPELISLTMGLVSPTNHYKIGEVINKVYEQTDKKVLFIASATLSAKLTKNSPAGFSRLAKGFEKELRKALNKNNHEAIQQMDPFILDEVGELAVRPICTMLGFLKNRKLNITEYNYSCPEGIGELLAGTL